ncbi:MAG: type 1 periplasmic binding fold superfamily protein [Flavicella sp.]
MKKLLNLLVVPMLAGLVFTSCEKDGVDEHEHELMTTLIYKLTAEGKEDVVFTFEDLDGEGGMTPEYDQTGTLVAGTTYAGSITILNEAEHEEHEGEDHEGEDHEGEDHEGDMTDPHFNVTLEIIEEKDDHQFFYTNVTGATISYADKDNNNLAFGLESSFVTEEAGPTSFTITLIHMPNKSGVGVLGGDITNADGTTDIEVTFSADVE